ncbi:MAG: geranylgeranyl reductase family protein [Candidatus Thorarchaeota archaeon]|jgi:digeranylgeranylglycerophospholipid reductase
MTAESYDVAVVGAGPAGSTAAKVCAEHGLNTVLIDRKRTLGVPVQCGEFLPKPLEMNDLLPSSARAAKLVNVSERFIENECSTVTLVSPQGRRFSFALEANVLDRSQFDVSLAKSAERAGSEVRTSTFVERYRRPGAIDVRTHSDKTSIRAKVIIAADGARSRVAKSLGPSFIHEERDLCPSINFVMSGIECVSSETEMFFGEKIAPGGYAWIIPKGDDIANVGLGLRWGFTDRSASVLRYLQRFIEAHSPTAERLRNGNIESRSAAIIPMGGPLPQTFKENVLFVGDAAGHVMASNGGGIPTALVGGHIAGQVASSHITDGISLSSYQRIWQKEFQSELLSALSILRIADSVMTSDWITELCMRLAGVRYLKHLVRCRLPLPVDLAAKTLVKLLNVFW